MICWLDDIIYEISLVITQETVPYSVILYGSKYFKNNRNDLLTIHLSLNHVTKPNIVDVQVL